MKFVTFLLYKNRFSEHVLAKLLGGKMKKVLVGIIVFLVIIFLLLLQINLLNVVTLFGASANIGIILVSIIGVMCGTTVGIMVGSSYGLMIDIIAGKSIGLYMLLYMLLGYLCGKVGKGFSKESKMTMTIITVIATALFEIATYVVCVMVYKYEKSFIMLIFTILKEAIYNMIIALILFKPLSVLAEIINKSKDSYYLL